MKTSLTDKHSFEDLLKITRMKHTAARRQEEEEKAEKGEMGFEEVKPHLNKIATLYLKNNKRKVGWIYIEDNAYSNIEEVYFVCVQKGRKVMTALEIHDIKSLRPFREHIRVKDILRIRSS